MEKAERIEEGNAGDDISAAWDSLEEKDSGEDTEVQHTPEVSEAVEPTEHEPVDTASADDESTGVPGAGEEPKEAAEPESAAPVGLSAAAREEWNNTPKAMREEIAKRERDFAVGIQRYAEGAKRAVQMDQALQPFQQYFAMNGGNVGQQVQELLQTASVLQMGSPVQRAQAVAQIISQFGVDIDTLDRMIVGEAPDPKQETSSLVQQQIEAAMAPYREREQREQYENQQRQEQLTQTVAAEVDNFSRDPSREFYREVRSDMADILDLAANHGRPITMDEAYRKACLLNPHVQGVITARQKKAMESKKRAASSVSGTLGGPGGMSEPDTMRGAIEQAWDAAGQQ